MHYPQHLSKFINALKKLPKRSGQQKRRTFCFPNVDLESPNTFELWLILFSPYRKNYPIAKNAIAWFLLGLPFATSPSAPCKSIPYHLPRDAFAIEETREYKGLYHNLGGLLSPLDRDRPGTTQIT